MTIDAWTSDRLETRQVAGRMEEHVPCTGSAYAPSVGGPHAGAAGYRRWPARASATPPNVRGCPLLDVNRHRTWASLAALHAR
jgi:hypothetical protein